MSGNVWEWTRSVYDEYPYPVGGQALQQREYLMASDSHSRVLRGGSFAHNNENNLRCALGLRPLAQGQPPDYSPVSIAIRSLTTDAEIRAVEELQRLAWRLPDVEIVPLHVLVTAARNGGLLLGAFDGERLAGFVFGFAGLTPAGRLKHCSHMTGVHPDYRDRNLGYRLKLAQRAAVLAQGIDLITWTFDPLEARNGWLNFHKLGAVCCTYLRSVYGDMRDGLNAGLPSDRLQVDWWIGSPRVEQRLRGADGPPSSGSPLPRRWAGTDPTPCAPLLSTGEREEGEVKEGRTLITIPVNFQAIKAADLSLAMQWRLATRQQFEAAFAQGLCITDLLRDGDDRRYLLESDP